MKLGTVTAVLTVVTLGFATIQGTLLGLNWFNRLHADYVQDKIDTYDTRLEAIDRDLDDVSGRVQHYQAKLDQGVELPPGDVSRHRQLQNQQASYEKRRESINKKLEEWEAKEE